MATEPHPANKNQDEVFGSDFLYDFVHINYALQRVCPLYELCFWIWEYESEKKAHRIGQGAEMALQLKGTNKLINKYILLTYSTAQSPS